MPCRLYSFLCNKTKNAYNPCIRGEKNWHGKFRNFLSHTAHGQQSSVLTWHLWLLPTFHHPIVSSRSDLENAWSSVLLAEHMVQLLAGEVLLQSLPFSCLLFDATSLAV